MFHIDPLSRKPVYEQIIDQMERFVLTGLMKPGTQLPSVRSLSMNCPSIRTPFRKPIRSWTPAG